MASAAVESVSSLDRRLWAWARSHPYTIVAAPILLAFLVSYLLSPRSDWVSVYLPAARRLLAGQEVFQEGYVYPPFMALLAVPLLSLPPLLERLAWWALNAVCLVLMCRWAWRLAGGSALEGSPPAPWQEHAIWGAGLLTGVLHAFNCLSNQQTDLVIGGAPAGRLPGAAAGPQSSRRHLARAGGRDEMYASALGNVLPRQATLVGGRVAGDGGRGRQPVARPCQQRAFGSPATARLVRSLPVALAGAQLHARRMGHELAP